MADGEHPSVNTVKQPLAHRRLNLSPRISELPQQLPHRNNSVLSPRKRRQSLMTVPSTAAR